MKKRIKSIALSTLFLFPMLLSGCENPFGSSNSIGSSDDYTEITPSNPNPSGGGGGSSNTEKEEDTPVQSTPLFYSPYDYEEGKDPTGSIELADSIGYVKSIYKKSSNALNAMEIPARITAYRESATNILTRLGNEYGKPNELATLNPLTDVGAKTFKTFKLMPDDYSPTAEELNAVTDSFLAAKYVATFTVAGSMQYALISTNSYGEAAPVAISHNSTSGSVEINIPVKTAIYKVFNTQGTDPIIPDSNNKVALSETDAFYKIVKEGGETVYLIYNTDFVKNFGTNFLELVDTHRDAIRYNIMSFNGTSINSNQTKYALTTKPWKICEGGTFDPGVDYVATFATTYQDRVAIDIASVMAFGVKEDKTLNLPTSPVGDAFGGTIAEYYASAVAGSTTADSYLAFVLKYVDHNGYVPYEADAIAEYLTNSIVGGGANSVLAIDETRYTQNAFIDTKEIEITFNSNEMMLDAGEKIGRKLIKDYTNTNSRAFNKNAVFKTISYETEVEDTSSEIKYTMNGNQLSDERNTLFKNYYNTFYSACYGIGLNDPNDISVLEINSDYKYLQNVTIVDDNIGEDLEDDAGDEDIGEEIEGEEDGESGSYDVEYAGKLQSIVIFPKEKINIRYIEICVIGVLDEGQSLDISADLRYHIGGQVYYVPNAFDADEGIATIDAEVYMACLTYSSGLEIGAGKEFKDSNNNLVKEKLLSFDNCVGNNIPDLRKKGLFGNPTGPGKEESSAAYGYNSNATTMGANYIYNELEYDFIEICFNVKTIYNNFDTNYSINAVVNSIYGTKV